MFKAKVINNLATESKVGAKEAPKAPAAKPQPPTKSVSIEEDKDSKLAPTGANDSKPSNETKDAGKPSAPQAPAIKEALRALNGGLNDAIVDMHVSVNEQQEADISRNGYIQVLQDAPAGVRRSSTAPSSTFGNKASLWIWRRSQGTCSGRFKPIVDIILESTSISSDLVLAGYICDSVPIAGQYLWTKRATTEEEEKDAIIDLCVTTGKMKNASDSIWQSPGVGWIRVDGNFSKGFFSSLDTFLWCRPARTRSSETQYTNPLRGAVALTDEIRQAKLISAVRLALRHYIPIQDVKRLSLLVMDQNASNPSAINTNNIRSERMMDYSSLYHRYDTKGKISSSRWAKMLNDIGLRLKASDVKQAFNFFDINHNNYISIDEYTRVLTLTDYEIDLAIEKIRQKLLLPCVPKDAQQIASSKSTPALAKTTFGVIGALALSTNSQIGKYKIRESRALSSVFQLVNGKGDNILSLDEMMDLAAKVEVFLTEEEARKLLKMMDVNNDDRVDETDFIILMKKESSCIINKAYRIRESAAILRRWLVRGTNEKVESNAAATASKDQWDAFKLRYEKASGQKFPGYISAHTLQITLATLGVWISSIEARELSLIISPEKNGRVHLSELHAFMSRNCRAYGELVKIMEKEVLTDIVEAYRACYNAKKATGKDDVDLTLTFRKQIDELKKVIENVYYHQQEKENEKEADASKIMEDEDEDEEESVRPLSATLPDTRHKKNSHEVIGLAQLRAGLQFATNEKKIPETYFPNQEELTCLAILVDADIAEGDVYGIRLKAFLEGVVKYIVTVDYENKLRSGEKVSLDIIAQELKRQIYFEAKASNKNKKPDYFVIFDLFDENHNGQLSPLEFKTMLKRLQLVNALPDHQIPQLIALFDREKKGYINYHDFAAFAEDAKYSMMANDEDDEFQDLLPPGQRGFRDESGYDDDDEIYDELDLTSNTPPINVTKDSDCDWLIWFFYRQACHVDGLDPESLITELEARCAETELSNNKTYITVKDFWNILFECNLQGNLNKQQFIKGIKFVCTIGTGHDEDRVDYQPFCKYIIRMGRGFLAQQQERQKEVETKFPLLVADLKKYFKSLCEEDDKGKKDLDRRNPNDAPRYEKIFKRIDKDRDGMLTPQEFRIALKQLHYKDAKLWTLRMVQRLFDECDRNKDGMLSIQEFTAYILERQVVEKPRANSVGGKGDFKSGGKLGGGLDRLNLSDDEEDDIFRKNRKLSDHELLRKVNEVLMEIVPIEDSNLEKHWEVVRSAVRRFFQRADPEFRGLVSEERFTAFLRRSGLQDALTASDLRRLTEKLKKRLTTHNGSEVFVDYEKLCQQLHVVTDSVPKSRAEIMFSKFQQAAVSSALAGRSFLNLCSLMDLQLTGKITKEELLAICKMMDCKLSLSDLERMFEFLPGNILAIDGRKVDYRLLQSYLQSYNVQNQSLGPNNAMNYNQTANPHLGMSMQDPRMSMGNMSAVRGSLPSYATPFHNTFPLMDTSNVNLLNKSITTPLGFSINTPFQAQIGNMNGSLMMTGNGGLSAGSGAYDQIFKQLKERVKKASDDKMRLSGHSYNLRRKCEQVDGTNSGTINMYMLQRILEEIGVLLNPSEISTIYGLYGRVGEENIYYDSLCRALEIQTNTLNPNDVQVTYLSEKVLQRLRELRHNGRNPRDMFEAYDLDHTGLMPSHKFQEIIQKLQLFSTEHQLSKAIEDFSTIGNRSTVNYEEFCDALERAAMTLPVVYSLNDSLQRSRIGIADGDGYDGFAHRSGPYEGMDNRDRFRMSNSMPRYPGRGGGVDFDDDNIPLSSRDYGYGPLSPPRVTDSAAFGRGSQRFGNTSPVRGSYNNSLTASRASPSKVGSKMWGSHTPLNRKGETLNVGREKWCCPVCLYIENPITADFCAVCDSPNYALNKDYQVKEQCRNCTFLNGQFAEECEMCGEPLSPSKRDHERKGGQSKGLFDASSAKPSSAAGRYNRKDTYY